MELKTKQGVVITDIEIPFWSMVTLLVQVAVAAIPAIMILALLATGLTMIFGLISPKAESAKPAPVSMAPPPPAKQAVTEYIDFPLPDHIKRKQGK